MSSVKKSSSYWVFLDPRSQDQVIVGVSNGVSKLRFFVYERNDKVSLLEFILHTFKKTTGPNSHGRENMVQDRLSYFDGRQNMIIMFSGIVVIPGPGGFSNVRGAVTVANAFGFALQIPVVTLKPKAGESQEQMFKRGIALARRRKPGKLVMPVYGREPNITLPKTISHKP